MIRDLEGLAGEEIGAFDVCIVGAGPAGISLALSLIDAGMRVCIAEGGGEEHEEASQSLYDGESVGYPMSLREGRHRVFGGAATQWGGRSAMLDPIDFERRSWIRDSGWPIARADLASYYERAYRIGNFKQPWQGQEDVEERLGVKLPALVSGDIENYVWSMSSPDVSPSLRTYLPSGTYPAFDWAKAYRGRLEAEQNSLVLLHANCVKIDCSKDGSRVVAVEVRSQGGAATPLRAREFVLCCGGIENARLLLDAPTEMLARMNPHDALGRYFMQHPRATIANIQADRATAERLQKIYNHFWRPRWAGPRFATGFALSERAQRRHELLNASAFPFYKPDASWENAKKIAQDLKAHRLTGGMFRDAAQVVRSAPTVVRNAMRKYLSRTLIYAEPEIQVIMDCEQQPDPESRIMLSDRRDALGMRRSRVDWRFSDSERLTGKFFADALASELGRLGLGKLVPAAWLTSGAPLNESDITGTYHFIGATRMSEDARTGVVDTNCRVHGVQNLYVAGASVFPTGGHANPTLTILALAIRLADHLTRVRSF